MTYMKSNIKKMILPALLLGAMTLAAVNLSAQEKEKEKFKNKTYSREFCSNNWSNGDKVGGSELREMTVSGGSLTVDGKRNGGIQVRGENRSDVLVRACVQTWGETAEVTRQNPAA